MSGALAGAEALAGAGDFWAAGDFGTGFFFAAEGAGAFADGFAVAAGGLTAAFACGLAGAGLAADPLVDACEDPDLGAGDSLTAGFFVGFLVAKEAWLLDGLDLVFKQRAGFPPH